jgi:transposase
MDLTIAKAARKLGIKPSTAKVIVKKYKETGRFSMRILRRRDVPALAPSQTQEEVPPAQATQPGDSERGQTFQNFSSYQGWLNYVSYWQFYDYWAHICPICYHNRPFF